jgi:hypothetical protein
MKKYLQNDWLNDAIRGCQKDGDDGDGYGYTIYSEASEISTSLLQSIASFDGSKALVSSSPSTQLDKLVKHALCFADLVIVVPAPLWVSDDYAELPPYSEFNVAEMRLPLMGSGGLVSCCGSATYRQIGSLFQSSPSAAKEGAVTFLPIIGISGHRWSHPFLDLPDLPKPYSSHFDPYDYFDIHSEAMYNLCIERLVAEKLGAAHLNGATFNQAVINDLQIGKNLADNTWSHAVLKIKLPALDKLPLEEIIALRRELPDAVTSFSHAVLNEVKSAEANGLSFDDNIKRVNEHINTASESLIAQMRDHSQKSGALADKMILKTTAFALGVGGLLGSMSSTIGFLLGGGMIWDLKDLISMYRSTKMRIRNDSFFFAAEMLKKAAKR